MLRTQNLQIKNKQKNKAMKSKIIKAKGTNYHRFGEAYINIEGNIVVLCICEPLDDFDFEV